MQKILKTLVDVNNAPPKNGSYALIYLRYTFSASIYVGNINKPFTLLFKTTFSFTKPHLKV